MRRRLLRSSAICHLHHRLGPPSQCPALLNSVRRMPALFHYWLTHPCQNKSFADGASELRFFRGAAPNVLLHPRAEGPEGTDQQKISSFLHDMNNRPFEVTYREQGRLLRNIPTPLQILHHPPFPLYIVPVSSTTSIHSTDEAATSAAVRTQAIAYPASDYSLSAYASEMVVSSALRLPPELLDYILDYLHDDKPSLRQCALTSRNWRSRSHHHLFHSVYIDSTICNAFTRLLESNPPLGAHVASMAIEGVFGFFSLDRMESIALQKWLHASLGLAHFSCLLHNLSKLELARITIDFELVRGVFGRLSTITQLTLYTCSFTSDVFVELFLSYPLMKRLDVAWFDVGETGYDHEWDASVLQGVIAPQLETVAFTSTCDNLVILKWLISQNLHRSIATVIVLRLGWRQFSSLPPLLAALASTLRNLRVGWEHAAAPNGWIHPVTVSIPLLSSLTVDFHSGSTLTTLYTFFLLSRLFVPSLQTLMFAITYKDAETLREVPWIHLAEACSRIARTTPLRRIVVTVGMGDEGDGIDADFLGEQLPLTVFAEIQARILDAFKTQTLERMVSFVVRTGGHR